MQSETCATPDFPSSTDTADIVRRRVRPGTVCAALLLATACALAQTAGAASVDASVSQAGVHSAVGALARERAGGMLLTERQLDQVAAGYQQSASTASASARFGFAATASTTYGSTTGPVRSTGSTSVGVAGGIGAGATADASTHFH